MTGTVLKGMTWGHPRGYDPMVACSKVWQDKTGVAIEWSKRSLQDFESFPVEELARAYDLIVIDHPHVGQITKEACLMPLEVPGREAERDSLAQGSVGLSYPSYNWKGHQWAFPIDAATQVQAWRPDLLPAPPKTWNAMLELARAGQVLIPLRPPHTLMTFYTLSGNLGRPCSNTDRNDLVDGEAGSRALEMMRELSALTDPASFEMDPIDVLERMSEKGSEVACSPLIYGYVNYAMKGFRSNLIAFADIPQAGFSGPIGSALGGTGIAVSSFSRYPQEAIDFAYWIASGDIQRSLYAASGGQPGHAAAWESEPVNDAAANFYKNTRATLEGAWLRPRHDGYMAFQQQASDRLNEGLKKGEDARSVVADLNMLYRNSFTS